MDNNDLNVNYTVIYHSIISDSQMDIVARILQKSMSSIYVAATLWYHPNDISRKMRISILNNCVCLLTKSKQQVSSQISYLCLLKEIKKKLLL